MGQQKNTVVINGKIYDAVSGVLVNNKLASQHDNGQLVTDFVTKPSPKSRQPHKARTTHHLAHHQPQKSVTLKRTLAHKKTVSLAAAKSLPFNSGDTATVKADKILLPNGNRYERAKTVAKSNAISRFNLSSEPAITKQHLPLTVQPAPVEQTSYSLAVPQAEFGQGSSGQDIFSAALGNAKSHEQASPKLSKRKHRVAKKLGLSARTANVFAVVFVSVAVAGFVAYQNVSRISLHFAANQAGLAGASLPEFRPAGFSLSRHIATSPGQIVLSFQSNSDNRAFTVTQASSNWDSQTLADSYLVGKQAQRHDQPDGKTIYLYGNTNATWVDGGIWYRIEGNSSLSSDQLLKIADSF